MAIASILIACAGCNRGHRPAEGTDEGLTGGTRLFADDFEGPELGDEWHSESGAWVLRDGEVHVEGARNEPLWLNVRLPRQVRVELDATAEDPEGDLKFEIFADGREHASGYIAIFGGWDNQVTCIARLDEHGDDRLDARRHVAVEPERTYHFTAVRTDNRLRWYIDGEPVLTYDDADPLEGSEHRYFALNNWMAPARYDNVEIYDLSE